MKWLELELIIVPGKVNNLSFLNIQSKFVNPVNNAKNNTQENTAKSEITKQRQTVWENGTKRSRFSLFSTSKDVWESIA